MRKVRFVEPAKVYRMIKDELDAAYFDVMSKGELIDRGHLRSFEGNLAKYVGTKYAVGLNSGYDALHLSLRAAGIRAGDEVLVPAHTFVATCSAVVNVGATPVLVVVEDACQSLGSSIREKGAGSFGLTGCWSFYPFKILGGYGDGGAITTDDPDVATFVRRMRYNGEDR